MTRKKTSLIIIPVFYSVPRVTLEDLSDELFYKIFAYLDGCEIYQTFSKLNSRFEQLLNSSSHLLRILLRFSNDNYLPCQYQHIIGFHRRQIFSIHLDLLYLPHKFNLIFPINSTLEHLESIVLEHFVFNIFIPVLRELACRPRLFSLTINIDRDVVDLATIYRIVFVLPILGYYKCKITSCNASVFHLIATEKQFSSIEHLVIDYR